MLSAPKNVADTLQNDKLHHALSVNCQPQSHLNCPANRLCYKLSRGDECRTFQARAASTGKAWSPSVERRVDGMISVDVEADQRRRRTSTSVDLWNVGIVLVGIVPVGIGTASQTNCSMNLYIQHCITDFVVHNEVYFRLASCDQQQSHR